MARKVSIGRGLITEGEDSLKRGRQSLGREADTCLGRGSILGEDPSADPGPSVAGPHFLGHIDGEVHVMGEDDPGDRSFP